MSGPAPSRVARRAERIAAGVFPMDLNNPLAKGLDGTTGWWRNQRKKLREIYAEAYVLGYSHAERERKPRGAK